ncbi:MAG: hypothetical protein WCH86_06240 [Kiritimatiellales bacterium]
MLAVKAVLVLKYATSFEVGTLAPAQDCTLFHSVAPLLKEIVAANPGTEIKTQSEKTAAARRGTQLNL